MTYDIWQNENRSNFNLRWRWFPKWTMIIFVYGCSVYHSMYYSAEIEVTWPVMVSWWCVKILRWFPSAFLRFLIGVSQPKSFVYKSLFGPFRHLTANPCIACITSVRGCWLCSVTAPKTCWLLVMVSPVNKAIVLPKKNGCIWFFMASPDPPSAKCVRLKRATGAITRRALAAVD